MSQAAGHLVLGPFFLQLVVEVDWTSDVTPPRLGVVLLLLFFSLSLSRKNQFRKYA